MKPRKPLTERVLALLLALVTATALVPAPALAEAVDELAATPQAEAAAEEQPAEDAPAADDVASDAEQEPAADEEPAEKVAPAADDAAEQSEVAAAAPAAPASDEAGIATVSDVTVDSVSLLNAKGQNIVYGFASYTAVKAGETIKVGAYYEDDWGDDEEILDSEYAKLKYQWYVGEKQSSAPTASGYMPIDGATSREFTLTAAQVGKYVACKVTYGSSSLSNMFTPSTKLAIAEGEGATTPATPDAKTLAAAKQALSTWKPSPVYGTDTNIVDMLSAKLKTLGYENVKPSLKSVAFGATDPVQQGGIAADGTITYFFLSNAEKTVSAVTVKPIDESEIDVAVAQMQAVKNAYATSILGTNTSVDAVSTNLSPWSSATVAEDGTISYSKKYETGQIHADDLPGYDSMAGTNWRTYRSSDTSVIADETLRVTQPEADTLVTVESSLTYEKYAALAKAHPDNAKLQSLVNQPVKATFRVVGTTDHADPKISVNFKLVGADADGNDEVWFDGAQSMVHGSTADVLIEQVLKDQGLAHTSSTTEYGYYLSDITSADGRTLGWDAATGKYWQLFVGGKASEVGAGSIALAPGDSIVLYYSAFGASLDEIGKATVKASVSFIGPDAAGNNSVWSSSADVKMTSGATAADLTEQELKASGLTYVLKTPATDGYFYLSSITRDDKEYGWDQSTSRYWQLYVNGSYSNVGADGVTLKPGDKIQWVYAADTEKPLDGLIVNPFASRPDWTASWNGFGNAGGTTLENTLTPTESASELWKVNLATAADKWVSLGDPIIAGGYVFVTTNSELVKIDGAGRVVARVSKGGTTSYFSRPVYADGLIISANDDGSVCAFSAETLECVWKTPALEAPAAGGRYQANSTMTVANGCVYAEFVAGAGASGTAAGGAMVCIDIATGKVVWSQVTTKTGSSTGEGYYWAGAAASGSDLVIGDESGCVKLIDGKSGKVKSSVSLSGNPVRATIVSAGTEDGNPAFLAVGRQPATLYKIVREGDTLRIAGSCAFANTSTSTPAVANGKAYIGGSDASNNGQFTVIDLASMTVEKSFDMGKYAEVKASPIASVQAGGVYVYFTCNKTPGALYCFNQSTGEVAEIYTPSGSNANYCTASVIADAKGNLYYTNDSGTLFALKAVPGYTVSFDARGGTTVPSVLTAQNKTMVAPSDPERTGFTFVGWYKDVACTQAWDFAKDVVTADMTLYAKWSAVGGASTGDTNKGDDAKKDNASGGQISPSGNGGKKTTLAITLKSNVSADANESEEKASLLSGFTSGEATGAAPTTAAEGVADLDTDAGFGSSESSNQLPIWPFIGMAVAAAALIVVLLAKRGKGDEE